MAMAFLRDARHHSPSGVGMSRRQDIHGLFMCVYFLGIGVGVAVLALDSEILQALAGLGGLVGCFATAEAVAERGE